MYQAIGRGVQKNGDGTITVKVEYLRDELNGGQRQVRVDSITAASLTELRTKVMADLKSLKLAEQDVALSDAIVGIVLGAI